MTTEGWTQIAQAIYISKFLKCFKVVVA